MPNLRHILLDNDPEAGVARLTFDHPERCNQFTDLTHTKLADATKRALRLYDSR